MPNNLKKAGIKYQDGGAPNPSDYIGNPMSYFNDKADIRRAQRGVEIDSMLDHVDFDPGYPGSGREERKAKRSIKKAERKEKRAEKRWKRKNVETINLSRPRYRNSRSEPPKYYQSLGQK